MKFDRDIRELHIHCTATKEGIDFGVKDIDRWHKERGWNGCGYHYVIKLDGEIEVGRDINKIPASIKGRNRYAVAIVYVGGLDKEGKPKDTRTDKQKASMWLLIERIKKRYGDIPVYGHNEFANKDCPCFDVEKEFRK